MEFSEQQLLQIKAKGISLAEVMRQLNRFSTGMLYVDLDRPATDGDGIITFSGEQCRHYEDFFNRMAPNLTILKFVPASGAATRMFKDLFEFLENPLADTFQPDQISGPVLMFAKQVHRMPFFEELVERVQLLYPGFIPDLHPANIKKMIQVLLSPDGMNYGNLPKAMLTFHRYESCARYAFEEHLVEAALLSEVSAHPLRIHFTVSPNHLESFRKLVDEKLPLYSALFQRDYEITYSVQDGSTDTVAADEHNQPFREADGQLLFRPGGHGALLFNLNRMDADIIYIKNIDNVATEKVERTNLLWKRVLGGLLAEITQKAHRYLTLLSDGHCPIPVLDEIADWIEKTFAVKFHILDSDIVTALQTFLDRPVRVCGMVLNTGEPGGGPFWVRSGMDVSLQIIESAQIYQNDSEQKRIAQAATHFNPVDLVCAIRNFKGEKFDLNRFSNPDTSFISVKSHQGRVLKALEHPGLWNGAMANWLTLFVEVPLLTFNPVKTVNDLLRPEHQSE